MRFSYASENGGMTDQMTWFQDLTVGQGEVQADTDSLELTVWLVNGQARFSYVVRCTLPADYGSPGGCLWDVFRPDIDSEMLFTRTENLFAVPVEHDEMPGPSRGSRFSITLSSVSTMPGKGRALFDVLFPFPEKHLGGNGFTNGFVSRYDATADTILTPKRRDLFTHDVGHKWLNNVPVWFPEGFNDMQTGYQLVASGLADPSSFATYFNIALAGLYHNPYRNAPDEEAEEKFWKDGDYIWLLYWRGFSYAFHLVGVYEKETGEPNAWKPMMQAVKPFIDDFTAEKFLDAMAGLMDRDRLEKDYRRYILEGKDFDFFSEDLPSDCAITRREDGAPQLVVTDPAAFALHYIF